MSEVDPDRSDGDYVLLARLSITDMSDRIVRTDIWGGAGVNLDMAERIFKANVTADPYSVIVLEAPDGTVLHRHAGHEGWGDVLA